MEDNLFSNRQAKYRALGEGMSRADYRSVSRDYANEFKNYGLSGRQARRAGRNMTAYMADNDNNTRLGQAQQYQNNLENYMSNVDLNTVTKDPLTRREAVEKSGMNKSLFADRYRGIKNWVRQQNGDLNRKAVRRTARNIMANYNTYFPKTQENTETSTSASTDSALNPDVMTWYQSTFENNGASQTSSVATTAAPTQVANPTQVETPTPVQDENPPIADRIVDGHDYTSAGNFSAAFKAAKAANLKNFVWKGKSYGTGMATTPEQITAYMRSQGKSEEEINTYLAKKGMKPVDGEISNGNSAATQNQNFTRNPYGDEAVKNAVTTTDLKIPDISRPNQYGLDVPKVGSYAPTYSTYERSGYYDSKADVSREPRLADEIMAENDYNTASAAYKNNKQGGWRR